MPPYEEYAVHYPDATSTRWPRGPRVTVTLHDTPPPPVFIPLDFLARSGDNTWGLVHHLMQLMVNERGELRRQDGTPLMLDDAPTPIQCVFVPVEAPDFTWAKGPQSATRGKVAKNEDNLSSSTSTKSSAPQSSLRHLVLVRDGDQCIVSNLGDSQLSEAAHLVPKSRPDIYEQILGTDFTYNLYDVTMAVTLKSDLHKAYDSYRWSFYCKDSIMFVHVFKPDSYLLQFHGHAVTRDRFNWRIGGDYLPDVRLCNWHYQQCVLKFLRRVSAGMAINAQ